MLVLVACPRGSVSTSAAPDSGPPRSAQGALEGTLLLLPPLPARLPRLATNASAAKVCGTSVSDDALNVSPKGALKDAVVFLESGPIPGDEKVLPSDTLDQKGCAYSRPVLAARAGSHLSFLNSDELVHTIRSEGMGRAAFNFAMPLTGMRVTRVLPAAPGVLQLTCDVHPWMRAVVRTFSHSLFAITDASGHFRIEGVPEGAHALRVWHPRLGEAVLAQDVHAEGALINLGVMHPRFVGPPQRTAE